jgi:hypothetical protein
MHKQAGDILLAFRVGAALVLSGIASGMVVLIGTLIRHRGKRRQRLSGRPSDEGEAGLEIRHPGDPHETLGEASPDLTRDWWDPPEF